MHELIAVKALSMCSDCRCCRQAVLAVKLVLSISKPYWLSSGIAKCMLFLITPLEEETHQAWMPSHLAAPCWLPAAKLCQCCAKSCQSFCTGAFLISSILALIASVVYAGPSPSNASFRRGKTHSVFRVSGVWCQRGCGQVRSGGWCQRGCGQVRYQSP